MQIFMHSLAQVLLQNVSVSRGPKCNFVLMKKFRIHFEKQYSYVNKNIKVRNVGNIIYWGEER